jgi:hypothetical protein
MTYLVLLCLNSVDRRPSRRVTRRAFQEIVTINTPTRHDQSLQSQNLPSAPFQRRSRLSHSFLSLMESKLDVPLANELDPDRIPTETVPENFVSYTLKHQETRPPVTWSNWYREIHWLYLFIFCVLPMLSLIAAWSTPLRLETFIWSAIYIHITALGESFAWTMK